MFEKVREMIARQLSCDKAKITETSDLMKDLGADSLDVVEMLMELESEHNITVPDEDAQNLHTVGDIVRFIEAQKK